VEESGDLVVGSLVVWKCASMRRARVITAAGIALTLFLLLAKIEMDKAAQAAAQEFFSSTTTIMVGMLARSHGSTPNPSATIDDLRAETLLVYASVYLPPGTITKSDMIQMPEDSHGDLKTDSGGRPFCVIVGSDVAYVVGAGTAASIDCSTWEKTVRQGRPEAVARQARANGMVVAYRPRIIRRSRVQ
jgi:hypothetical protein